MQGQTGKGVAGSGILRTSVSGVDKACLALDNKEC